MPNSRVKHRRVVHKSTAGILRPIPEAWTLFTAALEMHPLDTENRLRDLRKLDGIGYCSITKGNPPPRLDNEHSRSAPATSRCEQRGEMENKRA